MTVGGYRPLLGGSHLLNALGINSNEVFEQLNAIQQRLQLLKQLGGNFQASSGLQPNALAGLLQQGSIPAAGTMPPPNMGACGCGGFANTKQVDLGASPPGSPPYAALMNRQQGAMTERFLRSNPFGRQQLEMALGGRVLSDGIDDGMLRLRPFPNGQFPAGGIGNTAAAGAFNALDPFGGIMPGGYNDAMVGGLANVLNPMGGGIGPIAPGGPPPFAGSVMPDLMAMQGLNPAGIIAGNGIAPQGMGTLPGIENPILRQALGAGGGYMPQLGGGGGMPFPQLGGGGGMPFPQLGGGGLNPIGNFPSVPGGGINQVGANDFGNAFMNDPSLTAEDKCTLLLMQIMKKLDKEIEQQANNLQALQAQGGQGAQGAQGMQGGGQTPSIDVESMKLKRLIDKRNQMFDTLRQIVDKYNQTAKGVIDTVSRA